MDKYHFFVSRLAGLLGLAGNSSGEDPGEELEKTCSHKKFKIQISTLKKEAGGSA